MTNLEQRLRAEFDRQATKAAVPDATERFALTLLDSRRHRGLRWLIPAVAALVLIVPILTVLLVHRHKTVQPADPKDLYGTQWVLTREVGPDGISRAAPTGAGRQTLLFDGKGGLGFDQDCNSSSGKVTVGARTLRTEQVFTTQVGCGSGDDAMGMLAQENQTLTWQIVDGQLTITSPDKHQLIFTVPASRFPLDYSGSPNVTLTTGLTRAGDFRLSYVRNSDDQIYLFVEYQREPGVAWTQLDVGSKVGWSGPQPDPDRGCGADKLGTRYVVLGFATAQAAHVSTRGHAAHQGQAVELFPLPGTGGLQAYFGFLTDTGPGAELSVTDTAGHLLGQPCTLR